MVSDGVIPDQHDPVHILVWVSRRDRTERPAVLRAVYDQRRLHCDVFCRELGSADKKMSPRTPAKANEDSEN